MGRRKAKEEKEVIRAKTDMRQLDVSCKKRRKKRKDIEKGWGRGIRRVLKKGRAVLKTRQS